MTSPLPPSDPSAGPAAAPIRFDPQADRAPEMLATLSGSDSVVLLLNSSADPDWAADTAIALSTHWAQEGRRIVLADLHLESPLLNDRVGEPNLEGVSDIFIYGASVARSARPAGTRGFYLITAGTYTPDPEDVFRSNRWHKLVAGFADASATLVLFAPADARGIDAVAEHADRVVLLGSPASIPAAALGLPISAVLTRPGVGLPSETFMTDHDLSLPPAPAREESSNGRGLWPLIALLVAIVALAAAGYYAATARPDLIPWLSLAPPDSVAELELLEVASAVRAPTPDGKELPYSVQVKAFTSFEAAQDEASNVEERSPEVPVFVSPERIGGVLYFKVLAGASSDSGSTTRLRQSLVEVGSIEPDDAVGSWSLIQHTPLTFGLGEYPSREAALVRIDSLAALDIPAYDIWVGYSDGSTRWRVYGGAFRVPAESVAMREVLDAADVPAELVPRVGGRQTG